MSDFYEQAKQLAARPYLTVIERDTYTTGGACYVARNPELRGCIAQGDTSEQARAELDDVRIDFIECLLDDGLEVPEPQGIHGAVIQLGDTSINPF